MRRAFLALALALCAGPSLVQASEEVRLEYTLGPGAESCPGVDAFRSEVEILAGSFELSGELVRVHLARDGAGYTATIQHGAEHEITRSAASCSALVRDAALVVSLWVPPPVAPTAAPTSPAASSSSSASPSAPPAAVSCDARCIAQVLEQVRAADRRRPEPSPVDVTVAVAAGALMTAGFSVDVGPGFWFGAELRGEIFSFGIEARAVLPARALARDVLDPRKGWSPYAFDIGQFSGLLVPCARWEYFRGCAVVLVGALTMKAEVAETAWLDLEVGPRLVFEFPIGDVFALSAQAEVLFAPHQNGVDFDVGKDAPNVGWTQSIAAGVFGLNAVVRLK